MGAFGRPLLVTGLGAASQACVALESVSLRSGGEVTYDEAWLQHLIQQHPTLLPISDIEPGMTPLVPVCLELPVPSGYVDNLLVTPSGGIVVVETKLWRNPEARREVVGQILDYAKDLSAFDYERLQQAIRLARRAPGFSLFDHVCASVGVVDEVQFVDAVARNLCLGRFVLIIAGDGIQEGAEQLAGFLQRHVGLHFTLAMVEMSLWRRTGSDEVLVQPRTLAKTLLIERGVVRMEQGISFAATIEPGSSTSRPTTLTAEEFYEALERAEPGLPRRLQAFLTEIEPIGVFSEVRRNLSLKWRSPGDWGVHLGLIDLDGRISTDWLQSSADQLGQMPLATAYHRQLAATVPGVTVKETPNPKGWRLVGADGKNTKVSLLLDHKDAWIAAILELTAALERTQSQN